MENWLFIALIAPALWALVNLIDVYFVESVYKDEYDGAIIAGLFQILPWIVVIFGWWKFQFSFSGSVYLFGAGITFLYAVFFYFRALFSKNDASLIQILWNLTVPLTLFLGWLLYGDTLSQFQYIGCLLVFLGIFCLNFKKTFTWEELRSLRNPMFFAISFLSLYMLFSEKGHNAATTGFVNAYLIFSLGNVFGALTLLAYKWTESRERFRHITRLSRKYFFVFLTAETIALLGTMLSQRALDLAPFAGLVATIESLSPIFVMLWSLLLVLVLYWFKQRSTMQKIYQEQIYGYSVKILVSIIIAVGVYFLSLS